MARRLGVAGRMALRNVVRHPLRAAASVFGIGFAVAILMVGLVFADAMDRLIETQFWVAERQDVTVTFVEPRSPDVRYALARLPGVVAVEPQRTVAARIRFGHRERYLAVTGVPPNPRLRRIVDLDGRAIRVPPSGVVISATLADVLGVEPGDSVRIEMLEGARPVRDVPVTGMVDDVLGLSVYMDMSRAARDDAGGRGGLRRVAARRQCPRGGIVDRAQGCCLPSPAPASSGPLLQSFRDTMAANMNLTIFINVLFAGVIAFGVVYNAARVSLSERSHELATLRVLGFTRAEISLILMGELAMLTLVALPVGCLFGYGLSAAIVQTVQSEVYRFPLFVSRQAAAWACLGIVAASVVSGLLVRRRLDRLDLVAVLKGRE